MALPLTWIRRRLPVCCLAAVAVGFAVVQVLLIPLDTFLSWDEAVYAGQFAHGVPHLTPSAHRAPGMAFLLAPVTLFTSSFTVVRAYLTVLLSVALFLAFRCWQPVDRWVAPVAALLFAAWSKSLLLGHLALPNLPVALAAVAAVAFFARTAPVGVACTLGAMAILRPADAVFLSLAFGAAVVVFRRWRRWDQALGVLAGLAAGGVAWLVEAYVRFGGPFDRLEATSSITSDLGRPVALRMADDLLHRAAASPLAVLAAGVLALTVAALAVVAVRRACGGWPAPEWLLALTASAALVVPYYVLLSYIAHRYLVPGRALFLVTCASVLVRLASTFSPRALRVLAAGTASVLVLVYATTEMERASRGAENLVEVREAREHYAERIGANGIAPPCRVSGYQAPAFAYALGCQVGDNLSALPSKNNWHREVQRDKRIAEQQDLALVAVLISEEPPAAVAGWDRIKLGKKKPIYAYFAPTDR